MLYWGPDCRLASIFRQREPYLKHTHMGNGIGCLGTYTHINIAEMEGVQWEEAEPKKRRREK